MAIVHVSTGSGTSSSTPGVTISITPSGSNRLLLVAIAIEGTATVNSVVFNTSEALAKIATLNSHSNLVQLDVWYLLNPTATTANVVTAYAANEYTVVGASLYSGIGSVGTHHTTVSTTAQAASTDTNSSTTGAAALYSAAGIDSNRAASLAAGGDEQLRLALNISTRSTVGVADEIAALSASETANFTWTSNSGWVHFTLPLFEPAAAGHTHTKVFQQFLKSKQQGLVH